MEMGQWVVGHGSNGSPFLDGSRGSRVTASDPLTHDEISQYHYQATYFCFPLRLATVIAGGLILIYDRWGCPVPPCHDPPSPMRRMK